jgi:hypothetical protein
MRTIKDLKLLDAVSKTERGNLLKPVVNLEPHWH